MSKSDASATAYRLERMLDLALDAVRKGDADAAILALMEATDTAERLSKEAASQYAAAMRADAHIAKALGDARDLLKQ